VQEKLEAALEELDRSNAPADIGAHLDLALSRLKEFLSTADAASVAGESPS
jgi:hypothetical protein